MRTMRVRMLKRDLRLFLRCLLPAAALTAAFAVICAAAALASVRRAEEVYTPVKAAVVDAEDSVFNRMLIRTAARTDYIAQLLDISVRDMDEAMEALKSGELAAVIVLPEGVFGGITSGQQTGGTIYLSPAAAAHADIAQGAAAFGELLLASGQYGIFSAQHLIWRHGLGETFETEFLTQANTLLLREALRADDAYFEIQVTDYGDTAMSSSAYYAVSWIALLMMLSTLFFARLYTQDLNRPMLCRLRALGVGDGGFLLGKLLYPALFQLAALAAAMAALGQWLPGRIGAGTLAAALAGAILSACVCGGLMMLGHYGTPAVAVTALAGLLLCGGIIPRQLLPDALLTLGSITPYGVVQGLLMPLLGGKTDWVCYVGGAVYLVAVPAALRAGLRRVRMGGGGA